MKTCMLPWFLVNVNMKQSERERMVWKSHTIIVDVANSLFPLSTLKHYL